MRKDKFISLLTGPPTAQTELVVRLPEGNYAAVAILGPWKMAPGLESTLVEIKMREGHAIPLGPENNLTAYQVLAPSFEKAIEELISKVRNIRFSNNFTAPPFALSVKTATPAPSGPPVRLRRPDGTTVLVPGGTKALGIVPKAPSTQGDRITLTEEPRKAFDLLASPIETCVGRSVMYEPTPGAVELHVGFVEEAL